VNFLSAGQNDVAKRHTWCIILQQDCQTVNGIELAFFFALFALKKEDLTAKQRKRIKITFPFSN